MKKFLALAALVLGLASCQNEPEGLNIVTGGEVDTVITVTLPEAATRADWTNSAEGAFANVDLTGDYTIRYIFQVFYNEKEATAPRKVVYSDGMTVSFPVRLVPNRDYQFVVWADVVSQGSNVLDQVYEVESTILADNHYNTADLKNIQLKETWVAMDETRDAFTATYEAKDFNGAQSINIELYRPFAKLRVVTTDYDELAKYGITANLVEVDYLSDIYVAYNAFAGDVTGEKRSAIKHNKAAIKTYGTEVSEVSDENTIYTDYFFAPKAGDVVKFNLKVWESETALIKENNFTTDIQVKANYLTTLKGKVLTTGNIINITTNPGFGGTDNNDSNDDTNFIDYTVITSGSQFVQVVKANKSGKFVLGNNITIVPSASQMAATRTSTPSTTVINLNGKVITAEGNAEVTLPEGKTLVLAGEGTLAGSDDFIDNTNGKVIVAEEAEVNGVNEAVKDETKIANTASWLADVLANGGEYVLTADMTIAETDITATAPITIDGNNKTITTMGKGLRFQASNTVNIKNLTIVNASSNGRCIDTRVGNINLTLENVNLYTTHSASNTQPLTIGGNGNNINNINVTINNSAIEAGKSGYGIITFNPVALNINNSTVSGFNAIYFKPADGSLGSNGTVVNAYNSILESNNNATKDESNSTATFNIEDNGITMNFDSNCILKANAVTNPQVLFGFGNSTVDGPIKGCNITINAGAKLFVTENLGGYVGFGKAQEYLYDNIVKFPAAYAADLEAEGWIVGEPTADLVTISSAIAQVGDNVYKTLDEAVAAVEDGGTITLVANEVFTEANRTHNSGTWYDGIYYVGDKSFTIDLGGKTISQDGAVNDYLLNFKNDGAKANTITLKNGTVDAGTAAFCALCTSSSNKSKITINLEKVNLVGNNSNGSVAKIRGGAELNIKKETVITGKNSYLGIECVASTVNIYDDAEIYMNGTSSYNGCLAGACGGGTINVYGGYGKGVKGGFIAMTSGGTINVNGGEWIANTDGTIGNNSNLYVLTAQSNIQESGFVGGAYINVTGGTFRGGMDAWVLNNHEDEEAKLSISGGNFNANPTNYVVAGYKANQKDDNTWEVVLK